MAESLPRLVHRMQICRTGEWYGALQDLYLRLQSPNFWIFGFHAYSTPLGGRLTRHTFYATKNYETKLWCSISKESHIQFLLRSTT